MEILKDGMYLKSSKMREADVIVLILKNTNCSGMTKVDSNLSKARFKYLIKKYERASK